MGKRGPKPKPTALLKAAGSWRAKTRPNEPQPPVETPAPPSWLGRNDDPLNHITVDAWEQLSAQLVELRVLTPLDAIGLALLCEAITVYVRAHKQCLEQGETALSGDGSKEIVAPWGKVRDKAFTRLVTLLREYGLTPASRTGLQIVQNVQVNVDANSKARLFAPPS